MPDRDPSPWDRVRRSPAVASVLSFVLPGLGQAVAGFVLRGALIALPVVIVIAGAAGLWFTNRAILVRAALTPTVLLALVVASLVVALYRLWAIVDAYRVASVRTRREPVPGGVRPISVAVLAVVLISTVLMHGWIGYVGWSAHQTLTAVFDPSGPAGLPSASPAASPTASGQPSTSVEPTVTPEPTPTPTPQPGWAEDGRLNVLLIGSDAGPGRWSMRADAIIIVSVDIASGRVAAFSIPRYTTQVPLPEPAASAFPCRCLSEPINALYVFANQNPDLFPGGDTRGFVALEGAIEALAGIELDGMAVVDLNGFVRLVDAIGGITVDVPEPVYDAEYPDPNGVDLVEIYFEPGIQKMDGWHALAYGRTRHQDGDVGRMAREQLVIKALQRELGCDLIGNLSAILDVARDTVWTTIPLEDVPDMLTINPGPVESHALFDIHNPALTADDVARIQAEVAHAFDGPPPPDDPDIPC